MSRRTVLRGAAAGAAAIAIAATIGCESIEIETEEVTKHWKRNLSEQPLIPEEFAQKKVTELIQDEIFPRVGIFKTETSTAVRTPIARVQFKSADGSFTIIGEGSNYWHLTEFGSIGVDFLQIGTNSLYHFGLRGGNSSTVLSGEKATQNEAKMLKKEIAAILIRNFNQAIKSRETADVTYTYLQKVSTTSNPAID